MQTNEAAEVRPDAGAVEAGEAAGRRPAPLGGVEGQGAGSAGLEERVEALMRELAAAREALAASERRRAIDAELAQSDAVDLETARLLTEIAVSAMDEPDVRLAVADLRREKPFLFRGRARSAVHAPAMSAKAARADGAERLRDAAAGAMQNGDRASLLEYLRLRRSGM